MNNPSASDIIERIGVGFGQAKVLVAGGGVWLADGSELLLLSSVTHAVAHEWHLDVWQRGFVISIVFFGVLIGNLTSGVLGDIMGRRFPMILSYIGICFFSVLSVMATGFYSISGIRFFVGISFGVAQPSFNALLGEITPSKNRLQMNAYAQLLFSFGELYSACLIWWQDPYMEELNWRWLICMGAIPSFIFLVLAVFMLEESPSFLLVNGRRDEAQGVLERLRASNGAMDVDVHLPVAPDDTEPPRRPSITMKEKLKIVFGRHLLYTTMVVCVSVFTLNFLFYGGLYAFPQVLPGMKLSMSPAVNLMLGAMVEVPGFALAIVLGNYLPRKSIMLLYLFGVIISTMTFSFAGSRIINPLLQDHWTHEMLLQAGLVGHKVFTSVGFLVVYVYAVEIYPTVVRATGGALCIAAGRLGSMVAPTIYENLAVATGGHAVFFITTAGLCAVNAIFVLFLPYETKGLVLQDFLEEQEPINVMKTA